jgi:hypothetical protein
MQLNMWTARVAVFGWVLFCSLLVLCFSANTVNEFTSTIADLNSFVPDYVALALAVAVITIVIVVPMFVIDFLRKGAMTSWIMVELGVTGFLWILWVAAAGSAADVGIGKFSCTAPAIPDFSDLPDLSDFGLKKRSFISLSFGESLCQQQQAMMAFEWLAWLALIGYFGTLLVFTLIAANRGNSGVWKSSVRDTTFLAPSTASKNNVAMQQQQYAQNTPMGQPQQMYTPTGTPMQGGYNSPQYTGYSNSAQV